MSHQNGIISAPVELTEDVKAVLEENTNDLGSLCISTSINEWAKYKPLKIAGIPDRTGNWWKADNTWSNKCGFNIPFYDEGEELGNGAWSYVRPTGNTYPFRLYDFGGYKHTSVCPFSFKLPVECYFDDNGGITANVVKFTVNSMATENLSFTDIFSGTWYFGVEIKKGNTALARTTSAVSAGQNTLSLEGCSLMLEVGTVTITAFLTQTRQASWGGWNSGTRYSLNAFDVTSSIQCVVKKIQGNIIYFNVNGLLPADQEFFATIGDGSIYDGGETFIQSARVKSRPTEMYILYKVTSTIRKFYPESGDSILYSSGEITEDDISIYVTFAPDEIDRTMMPGDIFSFTASKTDLFNAPDATINYYYTIAVEFYYRTAGTVVDIDEYESEMYEGDTSTWKATVSPSETPVEWYCTNEYGYVEPTPICSLSYSGNVCNVTADYAGRGRIYCRSTDGTNKRDYEYITVVSQGGSDVRITDYPTEDMTVGDIYYCSYEVTPSSLSVTWSSGNTNVATITSSGKLTAIGAGSTTIYCTAEEGGGGDSFSVTVVGGGGGSVSISVSPTSQTITEGESFTLTGTTSSGGITWSSSNPRVAYTNRDSGSSVTVYAGTVTGDYQTAVITATSKIDNSQTASCTVRVNKATVIVHVTGISLSRSKIEVGVGGTYQLKATISPDNATNKGVTWDSSNLSVASVDSGGKVTGNAKGKATITATAEDKYNGTFSASCEVTVKKPVESVTINQGDITIGIGQKFTYTATVLPYDSTVRTVTWSCSPATGVISIDSSTGEVTGIAVGTAAVTATCDGKFDNATVQVKAGETHVASVYIDEGDVTIPPYGKVQLNGVMNTIPAGGGVTPTSQTWTASGNTAGVILSPNGSTCRVTARDTNGRATVTYTVVENGNTFSDSIQITVGEIPN